MGPLVTRDQFEKRLQLHLETIRVGMSRRAKREIGEAWKFVIDNMYRKRASDLTSENLGDISAECAKGIVSLLNSLQPMR
jgi:hypothetical protein